MPSLNFTKAALESLPIPAAGRVAYTDAKTPGLELRVTSRGAKTFAVRRRVQGAGKLERITLGRFPDMTVEAARRVALRHVATLAEGKSVLAQKRARQSRSVTLRHVLDEYIAARQKIGKLKESTATDYQQTANLNLADMLDTPVAEITPDAVVKLHSRLTQRRSIVIGEGEKKRKVRRGGRALADKTGRVLRLLLNFAAARYRDEKGRAIIPENPVKKLSAERAWHRVPRRRTLIERHQLPAWFESVDAERATNESLADYFELLIFTGLRRNEAAGLRVPDVDEAGRRFTVGDTKNSEPHTLPVGPHVLAILKRRIVAARKAETEFLFPAGKGAEGGIVSPNSAAERIAARCCVKFCPHDLRRTFSSIAESLDISGHSLKRLLNHKLGSDVTAGYVVVDVERLREPMQRIEQFILEARRKAPALRLVAAND